MPEPTGPRRRARRASVTSHESGTQGRKRGFSRCENMGSNSAWSFTDAVGREHEVCLSSCLLPPTQARSRLLQGHVESHERWTS